MMVVEVHQLEVAHVIALQGTTTHTELLLPGRLRRPKQAHCSSKQQQLHATTILLSAATLHTQYHTQDKYHYQFIYSYHLSTLKTKIYFYKQLILADVGIRISHC